MFMSFPNLSFFLLLVSETEAVCIASRENKIISRIINMFLKSFLVMLDVKPENIWFNHSRRMSSKIPWKKTETHSNDYLMW